MLALQLLQLLHRYRWFRVSCGELHDGHSVSKFPMRSILCPVGSQSADSLLQKTFWFSVSVFLVCLSPSQSMDWMSFIGRLSLFDQYLNILCVLQAHLAAFGSLLVTNLAAVLLYR